MRSGTPTPAALVVAIATAGAGCGSEELFEPVLAANERMIHVAAIAQLVKADESIQETDVVGDIDGDGIDDAILRTIYVDPPHDLGFADHAYILYGGKTVTGSVDLEELPLLTLPAKRTEMTAVGDVDGDGLADFLIGRWSGCHPVSPLPEPDGHSGAFLVYGSTTRHAGATPIVEAGAFLRDSRLCTFMGEPVALGDLDGDGKADFALASPAAVSTGAIELFVYYGRSQRFSGTVDLVASADAVLQIVTTDFQSRVSMSGIGDIDGDGYSDAVVEAELDNTRQFGLVHGAATRLSGVIALGDVVRTRLVRSERTCRFSGPSGTALGDVDEDGRGDFALVDCERFSDPTGVPYVRHVQRVLQGRAAFPPELRLQDADATLASAMPLELATGDVDGDEARELLVGDPWVRAGNGAVHVITRDPARLESGDPTTAGIAYVGRELRGTRCDFVSPDDCVANERVGTELRVGDLTGDGIADVLVGAPTSSLDPPELGVAGAIVGRAYVLSLPARATP
jgi:hypothetical protein